jgi:hypothetical protein
MPQSQHPLDGIADDLYTWMNGEVDYYVTALKGGHRSPFSAPTSEKEKQQYFARRLFTEKPDGTIDFGTPNAQGRDMLLRSYGPKGLADAYEGVMKAFKPGQQDVTNTAEELAGPRIPTDTIDETPQE